jgi:hypothetical protein
MGIASRRSCGCLCASKGVRWWDDILRGRARVTARTLTAAVPALKNPAGRGRPTAIHFFRSQVFRPVPARWRTHPRERQKGGGSSRLPLWLLRLWLRPEFGYQRRNRSSRSSLRTLGLVCGKRWSPRSVPLRSEGTKGKIKHAKGAALLVNDGIEPRCQTNRMPGKEKVIGLGFAVKRAGITSWRRFVFVRSPTENLSVLYCPIFRVLEYSESRFRTGSLPAFLWEELGILKERRESPVARRPPGILAPGNALLQFVPTSVLDCRTRRDINARSLAALGFKRTAIHFYFCRQVAWQEYSEFSNSALDFIGSGKRDDPRTHGS